MTPQRRGDEPTSVIELLGKKNLPEQSKKLCKGAADIRAGLPFNYLANNESDNSPEGKTEVW